MNMAARTTPSLSSVLMLGSQPRGDSTGSWEEGLAKGDEVALPKPLFRE